MTVNMCNLVPLFGLATRVAGPQPQYKQITINKINLKKKKVRSSDLLSHNETDDPFTLYVNALQLSATDVLARTTMKNAAKCDT